MFLNILSTGVAGSSGGVDGRLPSRSHLSILAHEAGRPRSIREEAVAAQKKQQSGKLPVWKFTVPDAILFTCRSSCYNGIYVRPSKYLDTLVNGRKVMEQINKLLWFVRGYIFELK